MTAVTEGSSYFCQDSCVLHKQQNVMCISYSISLTVSVVPRLSILKITISLAGLVLISIV